MRFKTQVVGTREVVQGNPHVAAARFYWWVDGRHFGEDLERCLKHLEAVGASEQIADESEPERALTPEEVQAYRVELQQQQRFQW